MVFLYLNYGGPGRKAEGGCWTRRGKRASRRECLDCHRCQPRSDKVRSKCLESCGSRGQLWRRCEGVSDQAWAPPPLPIIKWSHLKEGERKEEKKKALLKKVNTRHFCTALMVLFSHLEDTFVFDEDTKCCECVSEDIFLEPHIFLGGGFRSWIASSITFPPADRLLKLSWGAINDTPTSCGKEGWLRSRFCHQF